MDSRGRLSPQLSEWVYDLRRNTTTGAKARVDFAAFTRPSKGRSSTVLHAVGVKAVVTGFLHAAEVKVVAADSRAFLSSLRRLVLLRGCRKPAFKPSTHAPGKAGPMDSRGRLSPQLSEWVYDLRRNATSGAKKPALISMLLRGPQRAALPRFCIRLGESCCHGVLHAAGVKVVAAGSSAFLSSLRDLVLLLRGPPTACAVGCILSPLRG